MAECSSSLEAALKRLLDELVYAKIAVILIGTKESSKNHLRRVNERDLDHFILVLITYLNPFTLKDSSANSSIFSPFFNILPSIA